MRNNCHTKYLPALTMNVRFQSVPAMLNTSCALTSARSLGHSLSNKSLRAATFSHVIKILVVWVLIVYPSASTVVSQIVLFLGERMGISPSSPGPNRRTWSDAREADAINAV